MVNRHRMTRAELNEKAWELKKVKKKKGLARGTRSNPNIVEVSLDNTPTKTTTSTIKGVKVVRAIPLNIPGREQPLVSEKVLQQSTELQEYEQQSTEQVTSAIKSIDLIVKDGQLVDTFPQKTKSLKLKANKTKKEESVLTKPTKAIKLGKAALKRLEREEVGFGEEVEFFENCTKEKIARKTKRKVKEQVEQSVFEKDLSTSNRILSRDYKAGRNTDYARSQANAEKAIRAKKASKPAKRSGEELLDLWDSMK